MADLQAQVRVHLPDAPLPHPLSCTNRPLICTNCEQSSEELDITEKEGEFLTRESAEEKMARALSGEASIRQVCSWPASCLP